MFRHESDIEHRQSIRDDQSHLIISDELCSSDNAHYYTSLNQESIGGRLEIVIKDKVAVSYPDRLKSSITTTQGVSVSTTSPEVLRDIAAFFIEAAEKLEEEDNV